MAEILVIAGQRDGALRPASLEAIAAANSVKGEGDRLAVAVIAADPDAFLHNLSVEGVDEVIAVKAGSNDFQPDLIEAVVAAYRDHGQIMAKGVSARAMMAELFGRSTGTN